MLTSPALKVCAGLGMVRIYRDGDGALRPLVISDSCSFLWSCEEGSGSMEWALARGAAILAQL